MRSNSYILDPITSYMDRFAWLFWSILWVSLASGLGQEEMVYNARGVLEVPELITIGVVIILWISIVLQVMRQVFFNYPKPIFALVGNWFLLGSSTIFTFRLTWILMIKDYLVHISPIILIGAALMGIGLSLNALVGMKYADNLSYGARIYEQ